MGRLFANGSGVRGSIPGRVVPKTQKKWYLMPPCLTLNLIRQGSRVKWSNPGIGVAPSPILRCGGYWNGSLRITLDYGRQLYYIIVENLEKLLTSILFCSYIYIYMCVCVYNFKINTGTFWLKCYFEMCNFNRFNTENRFISKVHNPGYKSRVWRQ